MLTPCSSGAGRVAGPYNTTQGLASHRRCLSLRPQPPRRRWPPLLHCHVQPVRCVNGGPRRHVDDLCAQPHAVSWGGGATGTPIQVHLDPCCFTCHTFPRRQPCPRGHELVGLTSGRQSTQAHLVWHQVKVVALEQHSQRHYRLHESKLRASREGRGGCSDTSGACSPQGPGAACGQWEARMHAPNVAPRRPQRRHSPGRPRTCAARQRRGCTCRRGGTTQCAGAAATQSEAPGGLILCPCPAQVAA